MAARLCFVARDQDHLVKVPLQQAGVAYLLDSDGGVSTVLVDEAYVDRAKSALEQFGYFKE